MAKAVFQCEICKMIHTKKEYAERCEASHLTVTSIEYLYGTDKGKNPETLKCLMSDGTTVNFYRHQSNIR